MPEHPAPQLQQHLLADSSRSVQEQHPADGLDNHDTAQRAHDHHQRVRRPAVDDRRNADVDTAPDEQRNRKAGNVFHHDDDRQERHRPPIRSQQRAEQRAGFTPARQRFVDRRVVVAVLVEPAAPAVDGLVRFLRYVDGCGVGRGHRPSVSDVAKRRSRSAHGRVGRLLLLVGHAEPAAVLVVLPRAAAFGAVVELVVGGQQVAVLRDTGQQLGVRADVGDGAVDEKGHPVGEQNGRGPVCHHDAGDRVQHPAQCLLDDGLGVHVERRQGVVEHQNLRRGKDRPGQRKPLPLTAGQAHALFADPGVESEREVVDELRGRDLDGLRQFVIGRVRPAQPRDSRRPTSRTASGPRMQSPPSAAARTTTGRGCPGRRCGWRPR